LNILPVHFYNIIQPI